MGFPGQFVIIGVALVIGVGGFAYYFVIPVPHPFSATNSSELFGDSIELSFPVGATVNLDWDVTNTSSAVQFVGLCGFDSWIYNATGFAGSHTFVVTGDSNLCGFWANDLGHDTVLHVFGSYESPRLGSL